MDWGLVWCFAAGCVVGRAFAELVKYRRRRAAGRLPLDIRSAR